MIQTYKFKTALLAVILIAALYGCKKKNDFSDVTFVNRTEEDITVDLYSTFADYSTNANVFMRQNVAPGEKLIVQGDEFQENRIYYMDWYNDTYYRNNWYNDKFTTDGERVAIKPESGNNTYYLEDTYKGNSRIAFLEGDDSKTSWIAIGAFLFHSSTGYSNQWTSLTDDERFRQITVKKDFTANYSYKNTNGGSVTEELDFFVQQSDVPYIEFRAEDGSILGNMTGGKLPTASPPDYASNSTDTLTALFPNSDYIFLMVRQ